MNADTVLFLMLYHLTGTSRLFDGAVIFTARYLPYLMGAAFLLVLYFSRSAKRRKFYILWTTVFSALVSRYLIVELIRAVYHRPRPFVAFNLHPLIADSAYSFPSGHAAFLFAFSVMLYFYDRRWGLVFLVASLLVGIARVIAGVHYPSDIIGGMIVGTAVSVLLVRYVKVIRQELGKFR